MIFTKDQEFSHLSSTFFFRTLHITEAFFPFLTFLFTFLLILPPSFSFSPALDFFSEIHEVLTSSFL